MTAFAGRRVVVVGLGASGLAAATVLAEEGASVLVSERQSLDEVEGVASLESLGVALRGGGHSIAGFSSVEERSAPTQDPINTIYLCKP